MNENCKMGECADDRVWGEAPVLPALPEDGGGGGGGTGDGHTYTFSSTATGWQVREDGRVIYTYTDKNTDTTYTWQATTEGWVVKDNTGKVIFTYTDKSGENTTYAFEDTDDCGFQVIDSDGKVVYNYKNSCAGTTYSYEQNGSDLTITNNKTGVAFTYKGTVDTNTTYTYENYKDGFRVLDDQGTVVYIYDPELGKMSDGSYGIDTLLATVIKGHTTISTGQIVSFDPADLVVGETLVYDGVGTVGVITKDNGDGTYEVTTMTISPGTRQGVRLGSVNEEADLPKTCAEAEAKGWQTPQLGDFAYVIKGDGTSGDEIQEWLITAVDDNCNLTWTFSHSFNAGDYQSQSTTAMSGMILTGGVIPGTFGTPIDPSTLIRGVMRNGVLLTPDAQGKVNVIVDDSHIIVNALPTSGIVDKAEYIVIDANQKVTGTWVHDNTGWYQTYAPVTNVLAHQVVTALPTTGIEENVEYVVVDTNNKVTGTWVYDPTKGWLQTEVLDKPAHIVVKDLPTTGIDDEAEYVQVEDLTDPVNTFVATYVHTDSGWVKTGESMKAQAAHIAVTALPTTNINENAEYLVMTDTSDPTTLTGTWVRVNGNWVQTEAMEDGFHFVTSLPTSNIDDKHQYIVVENLANPDDTYLGTFVYDSATSKWVELTGKMDVTYNVNRDGKELSSWYGQFTAQTFTNTTQKVMLVSEESKSAGTNKITFNPSSNTFTLRANTRYEVLANVAANNSTMNFYYELHNNTDGETICYVQSVFGNVNYSSPGVMIAQFDTPNHDIVASFLGAMGTAGVSLTLREPFCRISIKEVGRVVDPVAYLNGDGTAEEVPVGGVIPFFGTKAPAHYLVCDGTEYALGTYPALEAFFVEEYGEVNHFGGNGSTTWAVPDLRGEFLRGAGDSGRTYSPNSLNGATLKIGAGAAVGTHQDPTYLAHTYVYSNNSATSAVHVGTWNGTSNQTEYYDSVANITSSFHDQAYARTNTRAQNIGGTSRPTNTSVNWCIKYEIAPRVVISTATYNVSVAATSPASTSAGAQWTFDSTDIIGNASMVNGNTLVAPVDGMYVVGSQIGSAGDGFVSTVIKVNGDNKQWDIGIGTSTVFQLNAGDVITFNNFTYSSHTGSANTGRVNMGLVNLVEDKRTAEIMLKPNLWTPGVEQSFGDGVYGVRLQFTGTATTNQIIDLSQYAPKQFISQGGRAIVDGGGTEATFPAYYTTTAYLGFWMEKANYNLHVVRSSQYSKATDQFDIWFTYLK